MEASPNRRVLVVDDDRDSANVLVLLLQHEGHDVRTAFDGRTALETVGEFAPELIVLDLRLRDMSGYDLAAALRESENGQRAVLVALTGLEGDEVRARCREAGFDGHIVKPICDFAGFRGLVRSLEIGPELRLA